MILHNEIQWIHLSSTDFNIILSSKSFFFWCDLFCSKWAATHQLHPCNQCNIFTFSGKKAPTEQTSSLKAQFLNTNPRIYIPLVTQNLSRYPETSLSMKPKGNYTVIDFIVIAIWHCAFQPPGSQFLLELHRLSVMALMKSLSVYGGIKPRTDSAPKLNQ